LQHLGVDKVNVLYCHAPDFATPIAQQAKAMNDQYKRGRFTHLGVSNFSPEMVQEWLDVAEKEGYVKPTVFQGHYNLLCRQYETTLFPLLRKNGIVFNAYSPLAGGFLLGHYTEEGLQGGSRFANAEGQYAKLYGSPALHGFIKKLKALSEKTGLRLDELSLRWEKYHSILDEKDAIILGASKVSQIEKNVAVLNAGPLDESVVKELNALYDANEDVKADVAKIVDFEAQLGRKKA
jgi:aflatoxin B1 aldehyde reductase